MAYKPQTRINEAIRSEEVRIIGPNAENMGVMKTRDALLKAREMNLDLIETSPNTNPPIAKIMDYGKFQYDEKKKAKVAKAKSHVTETKVVQVKVGTGEHDLELKAKNISKWLKERKDRVLHLITEEYKVADGPKKSPKGLTMVLEKK